MRTATTVLCGVLCLALSSKVGASPEITDELTYSVWQEKSLRKAPKRIILQHFNIWYRTTSEVRDGTAAIFSALDTLEPELALQITDTACAYLIQQLKALGYEVTVLDSAEIVKHKKMKKALKMKENDGAGLYNGSTAQVSQQAAGDPLV